MSISNSYNKIAVVIGTDHQNTLGVIRSLGEYGFSVKAILLTEGSFCATAYSRYLSDAILIKESELINSLISLAKDFDNRLPLIPCGDDTAKAIALNHERLEKLYYLPSTTSNETMDNLMNKINMLEVASKAGIAVPNWISVDYDDFANLQKLCNRLRFPMIVKPITLVNNGKFEFHIVNNDEELCGCIEYLQHNCKNALVQDYIEKTQEFGLNGCRLFHSAQTVFGGVVEKSRFSQSSLGSTTAGTIREDSHGLYELANKFLEAIDYRGLFDMEFISDGNKIYFVEMNFRNGGYGYAFTKAGRNFPAIWACEAYQESVAKLIDKRIKPLFFINESADFQNVRAKKLGFFAWFWDVLRAKAHMYINRKDMKPIIKKVFGMK